MIAVCAWCEAEGKPAVLRPEDGKAPVGKVTHGICPTHRAAMRVRVAKLREEQANATPRKAV